MNLVGAWSLMVLFFSSISGFSLDVHDSSRALPLSPKKLANDSLIFPQAPCLVVVFSVGLVAGGRDAF